MFARSRPDTVSQPTPEPETPEPPTRRREARDLDVFQPSTFASRKAERLAREGDQPPKRQLVSLGTQEVRLPGMGSKGKPAVAKVELFFDRFHPAQMFVRHEGETVLQPVVWRVTEEESVEDLGYPTRPSGPPFAFPPAGKDEITRLFEE